MKKPDDNQSTRRTSPIVNVIDVNNSSNVCVNREEDFSESSDDFIGKKHVITDTRYSDRTGVRQLQDSTNKSSQSNVSMFASGSSINKEEGEDNAMQISEIRSPADIILSCTDIQQKSDVSIKSGPKKKKLIYKIYI